VPALLALVADPDVGLWVHFPAGHLNSCGNKKESAIALDGSHYSGSTPYLCWQLAWESGGICIYSNFMASQRSCATRGQVHYRVAICVGVSCIAVLRQDLTTSMPLCFTAKKRAC
jgi:hypothetical protein